MRGKDKQQLDVFSYVSPEQRVPQNHPLRSLRAMTEEALWDLQPNFVCGKAVRTSMRRYTRLSNGFWRKLQNHAAAAAFNYFAYNFIKIHRTFTRVASDGRWRYGSSLERR